MNWKVVLALIIVLLLVGAAVADAKSKAGGKSGSSSKSFSSKTVSKGDGISSKAAAVATLPALTKSIKKKVHLDDDLLENETLENETEEDLDEQQSPGPGVLPAFLAMGLMFAAWRRRTAG